MENTEKFEVTEPFKIGKTFWLALWAIIGLALSIKLTIIYFTVNFVPDAMPSFCAINDVIDCDEVARTTFAQFLGIPLALYGVFLYSFMFFMCFVDKLKNIKLLSFLEVFKDKFSYIFSIYCISFAISMLLTFVQFKLIHKFCILCFMTYLVDFVSLLIAKDYKRPFLYEFKTTIKDFIDALKIKKYFITFICLVLAAIGVLCYTKMSYIMTPQIKTIDSLNHFRNMKGSSFKTKGNFLGNPDGDVIVAEYSDFECPVCPIMNRMLQKAAGEFDNIYVLHYNFPLDMECNPAVNRPFHPNACKFARFAIAAKKQDKYWEMINLLFDKKPKSNMDLFKKAEKIGIDSVQLANDYAGNETTLELNTEIVSGLQKEITATPTIFINNKKYTGVMSYDELKETLIENGATLKQK